jgi:predicted P-loop ATPase
MNVTVYKNFNEVVENLPITAVLDQIRDGSYRAHVEGLRIIIESGNLKEYDKKKRCLPAFTPSATFEGGRKQKYLVQYSGFIILDIDKLTPEQLVHAFNSIIEIPFTYACFRSPSNNGLKILVQTDNSQADHIKAYNEVKAHYEQILNLPIDPSGKDITRLCFFSWDPDLFFNSNATVFEIFNKEYQAEPAEVKTADPMEFENIVQQIEAVQTDITNSYKDWLTIGFALAGALGEEGRNYFHRISRFSPLYNEDDCNKQFDACLSSENSGITAKSFFFIAKDHGINISTVTENDKGKEKDKKKQKKNLFDIIERFLQRSYTMRYNVVTAKIEIKRNNKSLYEPMTDYIENSIFRQLHKSNICVSMSKLRSILQSDFCTRYDPFQEYFEKLPEWNKSTDYIQQLAETVITTNDNLWNQCFKKWIVAVVASLLDTKVVNHTAIIFSGAQGVGKTTWMENLCPPELRAYLFSGTINPNNKDTLIHLTECMLLNMDELENMNRTEIGTLKEIITKSAIRIRRSYGHNNESLVRRASFMGSVNTSQFLNDSTGSRRFLCFEVSNIEYQHQVDIRMVYAQAYALWEEGFRFYFDKSEVAFISDNNDKYQIRTPEEELLLTWFNPVARIDANCFLTATQIAVKLAEKGRIQVSTGSIISLGKALKKHGFIRTKKGGVYVWAVKELSYDDVDTISRGNPDDTPF